MPSSEILVLRSEGEPVRLAPSDSVAASSVGRGWQRLTAEHQHLPPAESDGHLDGDLLSVQLDPPRELQLWRGDRERRVALRPHDVLQVPSGERARLAWTERSEVVNLLLAPEEAALVDEVAVVQDPVVAHLAHALLAALALPPSAGEPLFVDGVDQALRAHLRSRRAPRPVPSRVLSRRELDRVDDLIAADLTAALRVEDLAAQIPMSPAHFSRAFKLATGTTPHAHVMRHRLEAARRLLATTPRDLGHIAERTGFADASHLSRQVRRHLGVTPGEYRRSHRP